MAKRFVWPASQPQHFAGRPGIACHISVVLR
jgi:hypothetical protein